MSAALVLAALEQDHEHVELRLVRGVRGQFVTVQPGTEHFAPVSALQDLRAQRLVELARTALQRFDYHAASHALVSALNLQLSPELRQKLERARTLIQDSGL